MTDAQCNAASTLARLSAAGKDRFDPVRFRYVVSLVRRSADQQPSVRRRLENLALKALEDYRNRLETARQETTRQARRMADQYPDAAERVKRCVDRFDYHGVGRLAKRLEAGRGAGALTDLKERIAAAGRLAGQDAAQHSLDAVLAQQEKAVLASVGRCPDSQGAAMPDPGETLRAYHLLETLWADRHTEALVSRAVEGIPENPGHLNSQMLATRCLCALHGLSPRYLRRWVAYMETLFWLEGADNQDTSLAE